MDRWLAPVARSLLADADVPKVQSRPLSAVDCLPLDPSGYYRAALCARAKPLLIRREYAYAGVIPGGAPIRA
jgi:hypothetical protein